MHALARDVCRLMLCSLANVSAVVATHNKVRGVCLDRFQIAFASAREPHHSCGQGWRRPGGRPSIQVAAVSGFMHRQGKTPMPTLTINGRSLSVDAANDTPLLWAIREQLQMTGTKFGCGAGLCGACTVHVNGEAVRSCQTMIGDVAGKKITTIEGLAAKGDHPLQKAWIAEQVPQCGYCQSGRIMQAASLLAKNPNPTK